MAKTGGGTPRWQRKPHQRRQAIIDASLAEFDAKGLNAARMDDIAAAAGLSKGSLYRYFQDKQQLFAEALSIAIADCLTKNSTGGIRDPELYMKKLWTIAGDRRFRAALRLSLTESPGLRPVLPAINTQIENGLVKPLATLLTQGQCGRRASPHDALAQARLAIGTLLGAVLFTGNPAESPSAGIAFLLQACDLAAPSPQADGF